MLLKGKIAIITGAASKRGLGLATARLFAEHGAKVVLTDLDLASARDAVKTLKGRGHLALKCDVVRRADCDKVAARTLARFGRIDVLINNAGITSPKRLMDTDAATYDRIMDVNMRGTYQMTQAVVPAMRAQRSGSIVNMSSASGQRGGGIFGGSAYAAAKSAILGYTKASARELGPDNIRVNAICPSMIDTDITGGTLSTAQMSGIVATVPMGRLGTADEIAGCYLFLASDLAGYVTGSELDINGGSHIH
ncbi:SDR family NAD(P)-dependent oxidoreductase [Phreatobacter stygius]|uniref:SDR family oxidoreductase n=1 Tax=Phreatobacter stygius TaxID=1940610 RepID=A0A4D7AS56_9HYPH|nr:SDR family NAD(P)-dependent oxidoreductase [Phreatobacter stygius]QCI64284.1 SDR family oxidoreductase [Phreatobacter stygius]